MYRQEDVKWYDRTQQSRIHDDNGEGGAIKRSETNISGRDWALQGIREMGKSRIGYFQSFYEIYRQMKTLGVS